LNIPTPEGQTDAPIDVTDHLNAIISKSKKRHEDLVNEKDHHKSRSSDHDRDRRYRDRSSDRNGRSDERRQHSSDRNQRDSESSKQRESSSSHTGNGHHQNNSSYHRNENQGHQSFRLAYEILIVLKNAVCFSNMFCLKTFIFLVI